MHFFYCCRAAGHFVRCGFVYVVVCYGAAICQCCRAPLFSRVFSAYGAAHFVPVSFTCCHALWCRARAAEWSLRLCVVPRTPWCRAPVCHRAPVLPRTRRSAAHSYTAAHPWCCAVIHAAAQFYVRPRIGPLLPRSSPYSSTVACVRAVLRAAVNP